MEINNEYNFDLIIKNLKNNNIKNIVISPGGTHIPLVMKIQNDHFFRCYSVVDERSAAYFAIGLYHQIHESIVILCTSAQATRNYIPGLTEAFYSNIPILAITMQKHPRFKYQGYMQEPDQTSLPKDCVKASYELPYVSDINDVYHSKRIVSEAMQELTHENLGPIQLCVPKLDFNIEKIIPKNDCIVRNNVSDIKNINVSNKKILLLIGEHEPFSEKEQKAIDLFCKSNNVVVYVNHLSNFNNSYTIHGNLLLSTINETEFIDLLPDIIITIGGQTGDYPLYLKLSKVKFDFEHWQVSLNRNFMDTYDKLTRVFQCSELDFFNGFEIKDSEHDYFNKWNEKNEKMNTDINLPFSNAYVAQQLQSKIPKNSVIQYSILNSLRVWNLFELDPSIQGYSNVGAFGIDGGMSTLIGQSVVTDKLCFMIIGDLAFYYDMNSLGIRGLNNNLRILLINNNGGIEFKLHGENKEEANKYIAASNHFKDAKGWANTCGFKYISAKSSKEFDDKINEFIGDSNSPIIFEVFVLDDNEIDAYNLLIESNKNYSLNESMKKNVKKKIKNIFGVKNYNRLKKIIRK